MSNFFDGVSLDTNFAASVDYEIVRTNQRVKEVAELLSLEAVLAVDTENSCIDPHDGWALLLQVGTVDKCYVFEHYLTTQSTKFKSFSKDLDLSPIKAVLENKQIEKILFNAKYDWKWLYVHYGIKMQNIFCCQVAERISTVGKIGARRRPSLADVLMKHLNISISKEARSGFINRDPEADPIKENEFAYAAADVALLPKLKDVQSAIFKRMELEEVLELENGTISVFAKAECLGVLIAQDRWRELIELTKKRHIEVSKKVYECFDSVIAQKTLFDVPTFKIGSQPQLLKNLEKLGFKLKDTEESTFKKLKSKHTVFKLLLEWREVNTRITRYGEKFLSHINRKTGRLHCQFNQVEADSGRASSSKPNMQQIPGYDEEDTNSLNFRGCIIARPGYTLITADFSQQELRILADMSGDPTFSKAYTTYDDEGNELDIHRYTASVIFNVPYDSVTKQQRRTAKTLNFFLVYGGSAYSLSEVLEISEIEAQGIIDTYFARYGSIKTFLSSLASATINDGFSKTISGRKRFLPLPSPSDPLFERMCSKIKRIGQNNPIQGSGADVTKKAMIFVARALESGGYDANILLVIHDELVVEVREDQAQEVAILVEREMIRGFAHFFKNIPMRVDAHINTAWEK